MYSDMSICMRASSSPNICRASIFARYVLPTPVGPRNRNEPIGLRGSFKAARERRRARAITLVASSCPTTLLRRISSSFKSFLLSLSSMRASGMPVHDETTANIISREVSDGIIAPSYSEKALAILKQKRKGAYNIIKIDENYKPQPIERKQVFGITFEQGRNEFKIGEELLQNIVTENKVLPKDKATDMIIALITLKYTQSNSVCFAFDGQAIGVGAGQQSRIHCTRLAAGKADLWHLRQSERVLSLKFAEGIGRPDKNNIIDLYLSDADYPELLANWQKYFAEEPSPFTREEKDEYLKKITGVTLASDAFFPFADNIERAAKSGVKFVAEPGGSVRDDLVIDAANKHGMVMAFTGIRLFHH